MFYKLKMFIQANTRINRYKAKLNIFILKKELLKFYFRVVNKSFDFFVTRDIQKLKYLFNVLESCNSFSSVVFNIIIFSRFK